MKTLQEARCCERCTHGPETPCADFVTCFTKGPTCHESDACATAASDRVARLTRTRLEKPVIYVGTGTCGVGAGADRTLAAIEEHLEAKGLAADVFEVGCIGLCAEEPLVDVQVPGRARVSHRAVTHENAAEVVEAMLIDAAPHPSAFMQFRDDAVEAWDGVPAVDEHPFFAMQERRVLAHCGMVDPGSIDEYLARGGYTAFARALTDMKPEDGCDLVERSGLGGRGGGGFKTGMKWRLAHQTEADMRYLVCNADEGDPGAFMDRAIIEGDPHRVLEGIALAAFSIGASKAYVYTRAEYPLAIDRMRDAIEQATAYGLLGTNILASGFTLDVVIKKGAGAFVCGEETALLHSIEGKRGMPRPRPPYPTTSGLFGKPTVINNVETLANVPDIFERGAEWFAGVGTEASKGTKVFALSGNVERTGLIEVPMGVTMRQIVFDIGGGIPEGRAFKAAQIGGPSGGCIPEQHLDIEIDYQSLKTVGAIMGSGGLVVMDDRTCMVDVAKFFMTFIQRESCGKCIPCREGTRRILQILEDVTSRTPPQPPQQALERFKGVMDLERLAKVIGEASLCGLGQTAPNPVLTTLRWFRDEYEAHVFDRTCPARVCTDLLVYEIDAEACKGCGLCRKKCPSGAIVGAPKSPHHVVAERCVGCGTCAEVCKFNAVSVA